MLNEKKGEWKSEKKIKRVKNSSRTLYEIQKCMATVHPLKRKKNPSQVNLNTVVLQEKENM